VQPALCPTRWVPAIVVHPLARGSGYQVKGELAGKGRVLVHPPPTLRQDNPARQRWPDSDTWCISALRTGLLLAGGFESFATARSVAWELDGFEDLWRKPTPAREHRAFWYAKSLSQVHLTIASWDADGPAFHREVTPA
jgi:hypothetical protein